MFEPGVFPRPAKFSAYYPLHGPNVHKLLPRPSQLMFCKIDKLIPVYCIIYCKIWLFYFEFFVDNIRFSASVSAISWGDIPVAWEISE
jgi:hypothetical protein